MQSTDLNICVFTGSSLGRNESYQHAAEQLGAELAQRHIGLVYGGASVGLMGAVADAALSDGGKVIGIINKLLAAEVPVIRKWIDPAGR